MLDRDTETQHQYPAAGSLALHTLVRRLMGEVSDPYVDTLERQLADAAQRNEARVRDAVARLGTAYVCHPDNRVQRIGETK